MTTQGYSKAGVTAAEQRADEYACERDARMVPRAKVSERVDLYEACMESKGYQPVPGKEGKQFSL